MERRVLPPFLLLNCGGFLLLISFENGSLLLSTTSSSPNGLFELARTDFLCGGELSSLSPNGLDDGGLRTLVLLFKLLLILDLCVGFFGISSSSSSPNGLLLARFIFPPLLGLEGGTSSSLSSPNGLELVDCTDFVKLFLLEGGIACCCCCCGGSCLLLLEIGTGGGGFFFLLANPANASLLLSSSDDESSNGLACCPPPPPNGLVLLLFLLLEGSPNGLLLPPPPTPPLDVIREA